MIRFVCKDCGKKFKVEDRHAGKATKCTECGASVTVPLNPPDDFDPGLVEKTAPLLPPPIFEPPSFNTAPVEAPPAVSTFAERTLMPGERIICTARIHSLVFLAPAVVFVGLLTAFLVALVTLRSQDYAFIVVMLFLLVPLGAVLLVRSLVAYWTTECVLTDKLYSESLASLGVNRWNSCSQRWKVCQSLKGYLAESSISVPSSSLARAVQRRHLMALHNR